MKKVKFGSILIVLALAVAMVGDMFFVNMPKIEAKDNEIVISEDDKQKAAEISNITGADIKEILSLREKGMSFNEIINELKENSEDYLVKDEKKDGLDKNNKLAEMGFSENEITEARMLIERVQFQLQEIIGFDVEDEISKDDYQRILKGLEDSDSVIYYTLMLKKELKSLDTALNEYICAVQLGLDIDTYFTDKEKYEDSKNEKMVLLGREKIITIMNIEDKMLKVLQNKTNLENKEEQDANFIPEIGSKTSESENIHEKPMIELPSVKPPNPQEELIKELKEINPNDDLGN